MYDLLLAYNITNTPNYSLAYIKFIIGLYNICK